MSAKSNTAPKAAAVIGAGLAGAAAARALEARGARVVLFDKGRGAGGRLSTKRGDPETGLPAFDHGAQYLTARTEAFKGFMAAASIAGAASVWTGRLVSLERDGVRALRSEPRWVGRPGMNALVKHALKGLDARFNQRVAEIEGAPGDWRLHFEDGAHEGPFEAVAITVPAPQAGALCESAGAGDLAEEARGAEMAPSLTAMVSWETVFDIGFDGAKFDTGPIGWAARMASRPGREASAGWVIQADVAASRAWLEDDPLDSAQRLARAFAERFSLPDPGRVAGHRWRYALAEQPPGDPYALTPDATLGTAGDWRLGPRAEHAWTSGLALGSALSGG